MLSAGFRLVARRFVLRPVGLSDLVTRWRHLWGPSANPAAQVNTTAAVLQRA